MLITIPKAIRDKVADWQQAYTIIIHTQHADDVLHILKYIVSRKFNSCVADLVDYAQQKWGTEAAIRVAMSAINRYDTLDELIEYVELVAQRFREEDRPVLIKLSEQIKSCP